MVQIKKKRKTYAIAGFLRQPSEGISPFNAVFQTDFKISTDASYVNLKRCLIKKFNVLDVFIFSIIELETTLGESEIVALIAEEIAHDRCHGYKGE